ncbi:MAG: hypothetical protein PWP37_1636 [Thermotogota bacterium]|nr:hypothetical protein [Thermotogota bacterium]MDK2865444.1 hypothetical protein [Thermotogota bacterium]HCZ07460.1 hypothetical protein [Thermotogota bacterium]
MLTVLDVVRIVGDLREKLSAFENVFVSKLENPEDFEEVLTQITSYTGLKMREQLALAYSSVLLKLLDKIALRFNESSGEICSSKINRCIPCAITYPWNRRIMLGKDKANALVISSKRVSRGFSTPKKTITWRGLISLLRLMRYGMDVELLHSILMENDMDRTVNLMAHLAWDIETRRIPWTVERAREVLQRIKSWKTLELLRFLAEHEAATVEEIRGNMEERLGEKLPSKAVGSLMGVLARLSRDHEDIVRKEGDRYVLHPAFKEAIHQVKKQP